MQVRALAHRVFWDIKLANSFTNTFFDWIITLSNIGPNRGDLSHWQYFSFLGFSLRRIDPWAFHILRYLIDWITHLLPTKQTGSISVQLCSWIIYLLSLPHDIFLSVNWSKYHLFLSGLHILVNHFKLLGRKYINSMEHHYHILL